MLKLHDGENVAVILSTDMIPMRLVAGRTVVLILSESHPGEGFEDVAGGLADVCFPALAQARLAA